ncbi:MAG TPA: cell division protein ZapA, partial [Paracoccus sp.]|nr:cell division protein ZapA [Paracoccus sp. (in: a-proteobacteria)]
MAEVAFTIGHKEYSQVAQDGEERLLQRAASILDAEAQ